MSLKSAMKVYQRKHKNTFYSHDLIQPQMPETNDKWSAKIDEVEIIQK